jgi:hypothetical protein
VNATLPRLNACLLTALLLALLSVGTKAEENLIAYWPLTVDGRDVSGNGHDATAHGMTFDAKDGALFDGRGAYLEVAHTDAINVGEGDFALSMWIHTESALDDTLGDLVCKFDPATRKGLNFGLMNYHGVVCAQSNFRHLFFGLDDGSAPAPWKDCGRPGNAIYPMSLCVYQDNLYAGTFEMGKNEAGHLYRYTGGDQWEDCGAPFPSNAVSALAVHNGELYAAASHYRSRGSSLGDSENDLHGGRVYRFKGKDQWEDCGKLGAIEAVYGLASFKGKLYASSLYAPAGLFRYDGGATWTDVGNPGGRVEALGVHNGQLLGAGFDLDYGGAYRFDDPGWTDMGTPPDTTQCYSFMQYRSELFVGSWPTGKVFVLGEPGDWQDRGQLGQEKESMGLAVYNGMLYGGTLPLAEVYRYDGGATWTSTGRLDTTPDVKYRRAWSMAVYQGKLFCGVLPSGRILSYEAGRALTRDTALPAGWVHLAAQRRGGVMSLYLNGRRVGEKKDAALNLDNTAPLKIGLGQHDFFNGRMKDLRLYGAALRDGEISQQAKR